MVVTIAYMRDPKILSHHVSHLPMLCRNILTHAPPEKVELIAPMIAVSGLVPKKARKFGDWITSAITPLS
jgi:hypothetical protein